MLSPGCKGSGPHSEAFVSIRVRSGAGGGVGGLDMRGAQTPPEIATEDIVDNVRHFFFILAIFLPLTIISAVRA